MGLDWTSMDVMLGCGLGTRLFRVPGVQSMG